MMLATYHGTCPECGETIYRGQTIVSARGHGGRWVHERCADWTPPVVERDVHPVCPDCFLRHPEGTCDL